MKNAVKTTVTFALVAALASAGFSQSASKTSQNPMRDDAQVPDGAKAHMDFRGSCTNNVFGRTIENVLVGKVKKVNTFANEITVTNSDGKDIIVRVSPFTKIDVEITDRNFKRLEPKAPESNPTEAQKPDESRLPPPAPKAHEISEIKNGSWVLVSLFKSDTKAQNAAAIFAKVQAQGSVPDAANAK